MKLPHSYKNHTPRGFRVSILLVGFSAFSPVIGFGEEPVANWIDYGIGGFEVSGNKAAAQRRMSNNGDFYGGIKDFHFEKIEDAGTFTADGHALFGSNDYDLNFGYEKNNLGFIRVGYREFRTWYDGSGGYKPGNTTPPGWSDPITEHDDELYLDRGEVWLKTGLRMESLPEVTFGYSHRWRDGQKDSTMWGTAGNGYATVPGYYDIDEKRDTFTLDVEHTLGNTDFVLGLKAEFADNDDSRILNDGDINHHELYSYDLYSGSVTSSTRLSDRMMLNFGYRYTTLDTDIGGSNSEHGSYTTSYSYADVNGGLEYQQNVFNTNLLWNPIDDLVIVPSFRAEGESKTGYFSGILDGTVVTQYEDRMYSNDTDTNTLTEALEVRYSGIENIVIYATAETSQANENWDLRLLLEDQFNTWRESTRKLDINVDAAKYTLGANWYPLRGLRVFGQYYHKSLVRDFDNELGGTISKLDAELKRHAYETDGANLTVSWRALSNLTFTTRYDYQQTQYENRAYWNAYTLPDVTSNIQSGDIERQILSETVRWNVNEQYYVQGSVSWINSRTDTPAAAGPNSFPAGLIPNWDNDYFSASLVSGYAIDSKTDVVLNYSYYKTAGYKGVTGGMAYGLDTVEHSISIILNREINENMACYLSYGFITSNTDSATDQSGGYNDFDAHMISTGLQVRF